MTPEEIFEFLFSAAAAGSGGARGFGDSPAGFFAWEARARNGEAARAAAEDHSWWGRYKPLTILGVFVFILFLLGGGADEERHPFSLRKTAAFGVRKSTSCGVEFYVSRFQKIDRNKPGDIFKWHSAVHREAAFELQTACQVERNEYASLKSLSTSWLSLQSTRDWYAKEAQDYRKRATSCPRARDLESCLRDQGERWRSFGRRTR